MIGIVLRFVIGFVSKFVISIGRFPFRRGRMKTLFALLAGVANAASFAPFGWWPLCLISVGILFSLWCTDSRRTAAWHGFVYGLGMFGAGTSWMYLSLHDFGGMPPLLAGLCIALLTMVVSLFPAAAGFVQGYGFRRARTKRGIAARTMLIMPAVWLLFEWLRGWVFTGFPWLTTGYAMLDTPLAGLAPLGGVYLPGLVTLMTGGALLALLSKRSSVNLLASLLIGLAWVGGWQLSGMRWTEPTDSEISVAIIQNNVPLMLKWDALRRDRIIADYLEQSARHRDVDLVVWPEAAVPDYFDRLSADFHRQMRAHPADFMFGVLVRRSTAGEGQLFNSIASVSDRTTFYHKQHLVPFGEFLPLKWLFQPLIKMLEIPMSDFTHWRQPQSPLTAAGNSFAASICYEDAFPQGWRAQVPASGILINLSEDSWFGDSLGPHQRLQMARFRSLESGRPMIRSSNNGLSSVINWRGGIDAIAPQFVKTVVTAEVRPRTGVTPYTVYGDNPVLLLVLALLALGLIAGRNR